LPAQGFTKSEDGRYHRDLRREPPQPEAAFPIVVEFADRVTSTR